MPIGFDLDEVLAPLLEHHCKFLSRKYHKRINLQEFYSYNFWEHYGVSKDQAVADFFEFYESSFLKDIRPFRGAREELEQLAKIDSMHIITARQNYLEQVTREFIKTYFDGLFKKIDFGNHFGKEGKSYSKRELCFKNNIWVLVEDDPKHVIPVSKDVPVVVPDKPWNRLLSGRNIIRAYNWRDIGNIIEGLATNPSFLS